MIDVRQVITAPPDLCVVGVYAKDSQHYPVVAFALVRDDAAEAEDVHDSVVPVFLDCVPVVLLPTWATWENCEIFVHPDHQCVAADYDLSIARAR